MYNLFGLLLGLATVLTLALMAAGALYVTFLLVSLAACV
jgi:hypothetical protein